MKDMRWQMRRCLGCGHEERFPALMPTEAVCGGCRRRTAHVRVCLCRCGAEMLNLRRRDQLYAAPSHKTRAWKVRVSYDATRAQSRRDASPAGADGP